MENLALLWRYRVAIAFSLAGLTIGGMYLVIEHLKGSLEAAEIRAAVANQAKAKK